MPSKDRRAPQLVHLAQDILVTYRNEDSLWYETHDEIRRGLAHGAWKARRLAWIRAAMLRVLTPREQECVLLYYFKGLSLREAGRLTQTSAASTQRALRRAVRKLREEAHRDGLLAPPPGGYPRHR